MAQAVIQLGRGAQLAKTDIKAAYRLMPVHPQDRVKLGFKFNDLLYVDGCLPFGLRSAPKLFNALADALEWCISRQGVTFVHHYLDDFVVAGPPDSDCCQQYLHLLQEECRCLGVPLADEKTEGPSAVITFLGITVDTLKNELRLPEEKLHRLLQMVSHWQGRKSCTRRELESLIGSLQHACKVVRQGRSFLRQAISLLSVARQPHHHIRLNHDFRSDLQWWSIFCSGWNGTSILQPTGIGPVTILTTDASGSWGCGAWSQNEWFQLKWDQQTSTKQIAVKELIHNRCCYMGPIMERRTGTGTMRQRRSSGSAAEP